MKVRKVNHGRIRPKYNPVPTAREKAYHRYLIDNCFCICGCGERANVVHHPLTRHPAQRWRRDHEFVVPMFWEHHVALHMVGDEAKWRPDLDLADAAYCGRNEHMGILTDG